MKRPLEVFFAALILGEIFALKEQNIYLLLLFVLFVNIIIKLIGKHIKKKNTGLSFGFIMIFFLFAIWGFLFYKQAECNFAGIKEMSGNEVCVVGTFTEYEESASGYSYVLYDAYIPMGKNVSCKNDMFSEKDRHYKNDVFFVGDKEKCFKIGKIKVFCDECNNLRYGNLVEVEGYAFVFDGAKNEGCFDGMNYYKTLGINMGLKQKNCKLLSKVKDSVRFNLSEIRRKLAQIIDEISPDEKKSGIIKSALLGMKKDVDSETRNLYKLGGIMHLLAISGLHISALGMLLFKMLRKRFGYAISTAGSLVFVIGFVIMTGTSVSALRAGVMFVFFLFCNLMGRKYDALSALSFAGIVLCLNNPYIIFSSAMQMSFGAILAILVVCPVVSEFLKVKTKLGKSLVVCICINIVLLPVLAYNYFEIMPYSLLVNIVAVPFMIVVIALYGFVIVFCLFSGDVFSNPFIFPADRILDFYDWICDMSGNLPGNRIVLGRPQEEKIFIYYSVMCGVVFLLSVMKKKYVAKNAETDEESERFQGKEGMTICTELDLFERRKQSKKQFLTKVKRRSGFALLIVIAILFLRRTSSGNLEIIVNYVGQGECIVIRYGEAVIMSDCGSSDVDSVGLNLIKQTLLAHGIAEIDYLFVSHTDEDHISGISDILNDKTFDRIGIRNLVLSDVIKDENYSSLLKLALKNDVNISLIEEGEKLRIGEFSLRCLFSGKGESTSNRLGKKLADKNSKSLILEVNYRNFSMLLTGDSTSEVESFYIDRLKENYDVLKVAHHGSKYSSSEAFLKKVNPTIALISCGERNRYGHPHNEVIKRLESCGSAVCRTDLDGCITLCLEGDKLVVRTYCR